MRTLELVVTHHTITCHFTIPLVGRGPLYVELWAWRLALYPPRF